MCFIHLDFLNVLDFQLLLLYPTVFVLFCFKTKKKTLQICSYSPLDFSSVSVCLACVCVCELSNKGVFWWISGKWGSTGIALPLCSPADNEGLTVSLKGEIMSQSSLRETEIHTLYFSHAAHVGR